MDTRAIAENSSHDDVSLLLPWYVNGSLNSSQQTLIEEHVRNCMVCRRELMSERRTLDAFRNENPLDQSVHAGFERLHSRIVACSPAPRRKYRSVAVDLTWDRVLDTVRSFTGARLRLALFAAPLAVIAIAFGLARFPLEQPPGSSGYGYTGAAAATDGYRTLSSPVAGAANLNDVSVIFTTGTSIKAIQGLLESLPAEIVDGPNSADVYTVRLLDISGENERQATILGLRGRQEVSFAEAGQPLSVSHPGEAQLQ